MKNYVDKDKLQEFATKLHNKQKTIFAPIEAVGSPLVATTVAGMTDQTKVYVYTGSETGYTAGNWYYYDGSDWVSGGVYNSATYADEINNLKSAYITDRINTSLILGEYINTTNGVKGTSNKRARTLLLNGYNERISIKFESNTYYYRLFYYSANGNIENGTGYLGHTNFTDGNSVTVIPPTAVKIAIDFMKQNDTTLSNSDIAAIQQLLYSTVCTDKKLILSNKSADSEVVGNRICVLENKNNIPVYLSLQYGYLNDSSGAIIADKSNPYIRAYCIYDAKAGDTISAIQDVMFVVKKITEDNVYVENLTADYVSTYTFTAAAHVVLGCKNTNTTNFETDLNKSIYVGQLYDNLHVYKTGNFDLRYGYYNGEDDFVYPTTNPHVRAYCIYNAKAGDIITAKAGYSFTTYEITPDNKNKGILTAYVSSYMFDRDTLVIFGCKNNTNNTNIGNADILPTILSYEHTVNSSTIYDIKDYFSKTLNKYKGKELNTTSTAYYVDSDIIKVKCIVTSLTGSKLDVIKAPSSGSIYRGSAVFVDFDRGYFGFYQGIANSSGTLTIAHEKEISFNLTANHEYQLEIIKQPNAHTLILTDTYSFESDTYIVYPSTSTEIGDGWGIRTYSITGNIIVSSFKDFCTEPYECKLLAIGDSFIEGDSIYLDKNRRYISLIKKQLNGSCFIDGVGGATTAQVRSRYNEYVKNICKPKYVLIGCGTNDTVYETWLSEMQSLISEIEAEQSIPILVTITRRGDIDNSEFISAANAWIRESNYSYIDINIITTENYDGVTQNSGMFLSDHIHPMVFTHELIFKRALIDVPQIFYTE